MKACLGSHPGKARASLGGKEATGNKDESGRLFPASILASDLDSRARYPD